MKIDVLTKEVILTESEYSELVARECLTKKEINMKREEAIKILKELHDGALFSVRNALETLIPELADSEDERIRKEMIGFLKSKKAFQTIDLSKSERWIAYLEKQKEQKPTAEEILAKAGLKTYKDGNQWCILVGDNIQEGICGFGNTIDEALYQLLKDVLEYHKEHKSEEWREDDKMNLNGCICSLHQYGYMTYADFLKHLPERFNLQPKQEWSEEDERILKGIIGLVDHDQHYSVSNNEMLAWLKSLRPQPRWKPSEEQPDVDLDALVDEAFDKYSSVDGYGQLSVSFNRAELYSFIKKIARKEESK